MSVRLRVAHDTCAPHRWLSLVAVIALSGCILPDEASPRVAATLQGASQYNHRGMVQNEHEVVQAELRVDLPTVDDGNIRIASFGNMDLRNDTGDAWFPNGHGGKFSEVDLMAAYGRRIGALSATVGATSYILPNGTEFPNGERGTTTEFFLNLTGEVLGITTEAELHYDWDEVDGYYAKLGARKIFRRNRLAFELGAHVGYSDDNHSEWTYGLKEAGLADLRGTAKVNFAFDDRTDLFARLGASTILDSDLRDWFDLIGINENNIWLELGVDWSF
ncbi:MAG: hypothetical protein KDC38_02160 [Planctomycetes bacterium]|nr:hypothetical protein [Planctomycetota bacterium]